MTVTESQATALANLLHELRPDWPAKSLATLIGKHRDADFRELCTTAVTVACDSRNQTPAVIFLELARGSGRPPESSPWSKEFHQFKTASEKRLATGTERAMAAFELANQFREQEAMDARIVDPFALPQIEAGQ